MYLDAFHFTNGDLCSQMEAHHYCSTLDNGVIQCILYSNNTQGARLMGVEYIITSDKFGQLDDDERRLWHSHVYEVKSGLLVAPLLSPQDEHSNFTQFINTYGKTWHTWNVDSDIPYGIPKLMMSFVENGQINPDLVTERDSRLNTNTTMNMNQRSDIPSNPILFGSDSWRRGLDIQLSLNQFCGEYPVQWSDCSLPQFNDTNGNQ